MHKAYSTARTHQWKHLLGNPGLPVVELVKNLQNHRYE